MSVAKRQSQSNRQSPVYDLALAQRDCKSANLAIGAANDRLLRRRVSSSSSCTTFSWSARRSLPLLAADERPAILSSSHARMHASFFCCCPSSAPRLDYMIMHLPFSAQGLFFLSGACISGSFFSFSSTYSRILRRIKQKRVRVWCRTRTHTRAVLA